MLLDAANCFLDEHSRISKKQGIASVKKEEKLYSKSFYRVIRLFF